MSTDFCLRSDCAEEKRECRQALADSTAAWRRRHALMRRERDEATARAWNVDDFATRLDKKLYDIVEAFDAWEQAERGARTTEEVSAARAALTQAVEAAR